MNRDGGGRRPGPSQVGGRGQAVICSDQPLRNDPKNAAAELVMSDYIMSVTGGAAATEPLADGNAMLCKNACSIPTRALERDDKQE